MKKTVRASYGSLVTLQTVVGAYIRKDDGGDGRLLPCDDWDKAEFRWPNPIPEWREKHATAVNVEITGTTVRRKWYGGWVRVKMTWVKEDEPDTSSGGWMLWEKETQVWDHPWEGGTK